MKKKIVVIAGTLLLACTFTAALAQAKRERSHQRFMRDKLELSQQVLEGVVTDNYDLIISKGAKLSAMTEQPDWLIFDNPKYHDQSAAFRRHVNSLVTAAKKRDTDGATLAYVRMTMSCVDCHKLIRGKEI